MDDASSSPSDPDDAPSTEERDERASDAADDLEALRRRVEEEYDFDDFGPADMARMSPEEWSAAFDPDAWITGPELLDRVEKELKSRIATRQVFAVLERARAGGEDCVLAYSDEGYAVVYPDGSVEGEGTVLRDVQPTVALCAMDDYEVPEPPEDYALPDPNEVPEGSGQLGNWMLQAIAAVQLLAGLGMVALWLFTPFVERDNIIAPLVAGVFLFIGFLLLWLVANARLSDRFRSEEYRNRLRSIQAGGQRPSHVPLPGGDSRVGDSEVGDSEVDDGEVDGENAGTGDEADVDRGGSRDRHRPNRGDRDTG